jgi:hypothetical protein
MYMASVFADERDFRMYKSDYNKAVSGLRSYIK